MAEVEKHKRHDAKQCVIEEASSRKRKQKKRVQGFEYRCGSEDNVDFLFPLSSSLAFLRCHEGSTCSCMHVQVSTHAHTNKPLHIFLALSHIRMLQRRYRGASAFFYVFVFWGAHRANLLEAGFAFSNRGPAKRKSGEDMCKRGKGMGKNSREQKCHYHAQPA